MHAMWTAMVLASAATAADSKVIVRGGEKTARLVVVTVNVPEGLGDSVIVEDADGNNVLAQADTRDGKPAVTWLIPALEAGAVKEYRLSRDSAKSKRLMQPGDKGVYLLTDKAKKGIGVLIDGKSFTTYQTASGPKPYCWPIIGPTGVGVTRDYPMRCDRFGEAFDHEHHRSMWFTHGKVGGSDFWSEVVKDGKKVHGSQLHRKVLSIVSGPVFGEFVCATDWLSVDGVKVCEDVRRMRIYRVDDARLFDFEIAVKASEKDLLFGDDKEGTFGFRVAGPLTVDHQGKKSGTLVSSNGDKDKDVWGKRAEWCDYYGPLEGQVVGLAVFDHPKNLRHPTYWHARTYGLFCANPFGLSHFTNKKENGDHTVSKGDELRLNYRVYIHKGDTESAKVADHYAAYKHPPTVEVK